MPTGEEVAKLLKIEKNLIKKYGFKERVVVIEDSCPHLKSFFEKKLKHTFIKKLTLTYEDDGNLFINAFSPEEGCFATLYKCKYSEKKLQEILKKFS